MLSHSTKLLLIALFFVINVSSADEKATNCKQADDCVEARSLLGFGKKMLDGVMLTAEYTLSGGQDYISIDRDVTFWCVKPRSNKIRKTYYNDPKIESKVDFTKPVNFVIHGWLSGIYDGNMHSALNDRKEKGWMQPVSVEWASYSDCNVCAVDWSRLANFFYPMAAFEHTKIVSAAVVRFIRFLSSHGTQIDQISIAGHSLGAQIAGQVGARFKGRLHAIYGLDPAGPGFSFPFDIGPNDRLDPSDAKYVQCMYTNRGTFGTSIDCGHGNFIMNGGANQPQCMTPVCSHSKATDYFRLFLNPKIKFTSVNSRTHSQIKDRPGIHSDRKHGKFYINTGSVQFTFGSSFPSNRNISSNNRSKRNGMPKMHIRVNSIPRTQQPKQPF